MDGLGDSPTRNMESVRVVERSTAGGIYLYAGSTDNASECRRERSRTAQSRMKNYVGPHKFGFRMRIEFNK